jgi:hypothetical protein
MGKRQKFDRGAAKKSGKQNLKKKGQGKNREFTRAREGAAFFCRIATPSSKKRAFVAWCGVIDELVLCIMYILS